MITVIKHGHQAFH